MARVNVRPSCIPDDFLKGYGGGVCLYFTAVPSKPLQWRDKLKYFKTVTVERKKKIGGNEKIVFYKKQQQQQQQKVMDIMVVSCFQRNLSKLKSLIRIRQRLE